MADNSNANPEKRKAAIRLFIFTSKGALPLKLQALGDAGAASAPGRIEPLRIRRSPIVSRRKFNKTNKQCQGRNYRT
jgi:hypothetical protein